MNEKRKKILTIVAFVLVVVAISLGGIVAVDILIPKEKVEDTKTPSENPVPTTSPLPSEERVEEKEIPIELAEKLYKMLYIPYDCRDILYSHYKKANIMPDDFSNEEKNDIVLWNLIHGNYSVGDNKAGNPKYTKQQIIDMKNQIFGENASFEIINDKEINCLKFYLEEDDTYSVQIQCGLDSCTPTVITKFSKVVQKKDKIILEIPTVFLRYDEDNSYTAYYYADYGTTELLAKNVFLTLENFRLKFEEIDWEYYESKASKYRYTYQDNEDGTYTFLQIERVPG